MRIRRILAVDPTSRGFGFVFFESPDRLIDWGTTCLRSTDEKHIVTRLSDLFDQAQPDLLVIENYADSVCRRCQRVKELLAVIEGLAASSGIRIRLVSFRIVRQSFSTIGAVTKHQIATAIAQRFPELAPRLPPERKPWMSEDERMSMFDAAALASVTCPEIRPIGVERTRRRLDCEV